MVEVKQCLDTYALVEIKKGSPNYASLLSMEFVITDLTLVEFYAVLLREEGQKSADYWWGRLTTRSEPVPLHILIEAVRFRHKHRKRRISFFDAVGYSYAIAKNMVFVTGDKGFEKLPHVDFRK